MTRYFRVTVAISLAGTVMMAIGGHVAAAPPIRRPAPEGPTIVRLAVDPASAQLEQERARLEESIARERLGQGEASGHIAKLENQLTALIAYGKSMFHREAARRQDHTQKRQIILEQLSDHVRHHLDSAGTAASNLAEANAGSSTYRGNGA